MKSQSINDMVNFQNNLDDIFKELNLELAKPNIFNILRLERAEIRHSNFIAWLMSPAENHGLKGTFLKCFLSNIFNDNNLCSDVSKIDFRNFTVQREYGFIPDIKDGNRRYIDILLTNNADQLLVCIENKIDSHENNGQLNIYKQYIEDKAEFKNYNKIYLYLTPTNEVINSFGWIKISYDYIQTATEVCYNLSNGINKQYIGDYLLILRRNIMNNDEKFMQICVDTYMKNPEAFDAVFRVINNPYTYFIMKVLNEAKSSGKIYFINENNRPKNTEFIFSTQELDRIFPPVLGKSSKYIKAPNQIVYNIIVYNNKISFTAMLTKLMNEEYAKVILEMMGSNKSVGENNRVNIISPLKKDELITDFSKIEVAVKDFVEKNIVDFEKILAKKFSK